MNNRIISIISFLSISFLNATIYENGEDKTTKGWSVYNNISNATIKNIYDKEKKSRVISLSSDDTRVGYMFPLERDSKTWCKSKGKSLHWSMKTNKDFVIFVSLQTTNGHRSLIYTSSEKNGSGFYGLGQDSTNGKWHKFIRDLDLDLKRYEPTNKIIAVDTFFIRGNVEIDDIEIKDIKDKSKKKFVVEKNKSCNIYVPKLNKSVEMDINDVTPPKIKLKGYPTVYLKLGEDYVEQGAKAIDNVDGEVGVEISGDLDVNRVGTYTLFYMAKDRVGNTSISTRIVNVGMSQKSKNVPVRKEKQKYKKEEIESLDNDKKLDLDKFNFSEDELMFQETEAEE
jgi:hypothetical protein